MPAFHVPDGHVHDGKHLLPLSAVKADPAPTFQSTAEVQTAIRPFRFHATDEQLDDLRWRVAATRWPSRELVADASQGVQLATLQELARYWQHVTGSPITTGDNVRPG
jgi:hypothetical protein